MEQEKGCNVVTAGSVGEAISSLNAPRSAPSFWMCGCPGGPAWSCWNPEIPVNIYELGLIYEVIVDASGAGGIRMTLTAPACPAAQFLPGQVRDKVAAMSDVTDVQVDVVWDPPRDRNRMSEAAKLTQYLAQFEPRPDEVVPIETDDTWLELTPAVHHETNFDAAGQRAASLRQLFVGVALAIGLAGYFAFHGTRTPALPSETPAERSAHETLPPSTVPGPVETATSGLHDANAPATRRQDVVLLDIRTLGPCWVSATADGLRVVYRLMQAGERQTIKRAMKSFFG